MINGAYFCGSARNSCPSSGERIINFTRIGAKFRRNARCMLKNGRSSTSTSAEKYTVISSPPRFAVTRSRVKCPFSSCAAPSSMPSHCSAIVRHLVDVGEKRWADAQACLRGFAPQIPSSPCVGSKTHKSLPLWREVLLVDISKLGLNSKIKKFAILSFAGNGYSPPMGRIAFCLQSVPPSLREVLHINAFTAFYESRQSKSAPNRRSPSAAVVPF